VPRCYYADYDAATLAHVLLLEDLTPAAAGDLSHGISVEVALAYTRSIAALHAHWREHDRLDALAGHFPPHGVTLAQGYAAGLERGLAVVQPYLDATTRRLAARLQDGLQERWNHQYTAPRTLIHWDAHAANLLLPATAGGPWTVVDWQNCTIAPGIWDVARFCVMSLPVTERRAAQCTILALYAKTLAAHGIPNYPYAQCWADYQAVLPLLFAQQVRFFASVQHWDATRLAWIEAITPRVVAALHDAAEAGLVGAGYG
jgi:aminoglycoside/choline kinase family phosphotransferase